MAKVSHETQSRKLFEVNQLEAKKYILPAIGNLDLVEIKLPVVLNLCRKIEMARCVRAVISQVFGFSMA